MITEEDGQDETTSGTEATPEPEGEPGEVVFLAPGEEGAEAEGDDLRSEAFDEILDLVFAQASRPFETVCEQQWPRERGLESPRVVLLSRGRHNFNVSLEKEDHDHRAIVIASMIFSRWTTSPQHTVPVLGQGARRVWLSHWFSWLENHPAGFEHKLGLAACYLAYISDVQLFAHLGVITAEVISSNPVDDEG